MTEKRSYCPDLKVADCRFGDEKRKKRARRWMCVWHVHGILGRCIWDYDRAGRRKNLGDPRHDEEVWKGSTVDVCRRVHRVYLVRKNLRVEKDDSGFG